MKPTNKNQPLKNSNIKHNVFLFMLTLIMTIGLAGVGCEDKDAILGPRGPEGPQGPVGPVGEDGSVIYAGKGAPVSNLGKIGDYYLDTNTGEFYGPKDSKGWGNPIIVLMGEDGEDGSQIYAGNGKPPATLGKIGDYYLNKNNGGFYGPKTKKGWGKPINIKGDDGEDGSRIYAGNGKPPATLGKIGDYYLNKNNGDFYGPKTKKGWGKPINIKGEDGEDGQDGEDGSQIYAGNGKPAKSLGKQGDYYLDKSKYDLYGPKTSKGWGMPLNLKGAEGNANVTRYLYPGHDFSSDGALSRLIPGIQNKAEMQQSAWLVYILNSGPSLDFYYALPGYGSDGDSQYRMFHYYSDDNGVIFALQLVTGPGEEYEQIEIVRIKSSNTEDLTSVGSSIIPKHLDVSDYEEVAEYYGFGTEFAAVSHN